MLHFDGNCRKRLNMLQCTEHMLLNMPHASTLELIYMHSPCRDLMLDENHFILLNAVRAH